MLINQMAVQWRFEHKVASVSGFYHANNFEKKKKKRKRKEKRTSLAGEHPPGLPAHAHAPGSKPLKDGMDCFSDCWWKSFDCPG